MLCSWILVTYAAISPDRRSYVIAVAAWIIHINSFEPRRSPQQSSGSPLAQNRKLKASHTRLLKHTPYSVYADGWGVLCWDISFFFRKVKPVDCYHLFTQSRTAIK